VRISVEQIAEALSHEVFKREVLEGEKADEARKLVARAASKALRQKKSRASADDSAGGVVASGVGEVVGEEVGPA
jgi:hypothetical protein